MSHPPETYSVIIAASNGCSFNIKFLHSTIGNISDPYYETVIDEVNYKEIVSATNEYEAGSPVGGLYDAIPGYNTSPSTRPIQVNQTGMAISKGILHNYLSASCATFKIFLILAPILGLYRAQMGNCFLERQDWKILVQLQRSCNANSKCF